MNDKEINNKIQLFVIIFGISLISIFIFIISNNPAVLYTEQAKNICLFIGVLTFILLGLVSFIIKKISKNELIKNYQKILIEQYGSNVNVKNINSYEIVAGDKSKKGTLRKKNIVEMFVPQYNCSIINYKLQQSRSYGHYSSNNYNIYYKYFNIANMIDYKYPLPNTNYDLNNPNLQNIINNLNNTRNIKVKIENNYLIIEKRLDKDYTLDSIKSDINDIQIFFEQIYTQLTPNNNLNKQNNNEDLKTKIIAHQKHHVDLASHRFKSALTGIVLLIVAIINIIMNPFNYIMSLFLLLCSIIMFIAHYICTKIDITIGEIPFVIGLIIIIVLYKTVFELPIFDKLKFESYAKNIENIFENRKFYIEENKIYEISHRDIYLNDIKIYDFYNDVSLDEGYVIVNDNQVKYMLEDNNTCIYKDFYDNKYTYANEKCNFDNYKNTLPK